MVVAVCGNQTDQHKQTNEHLDRTFLLLIRVISVPRGSVTSLTLLRRNGKGSASLPFIATLFVCGTLTTVLANTFKVSGVIFQRQLPLLSTQCRSWVACFRGKINPRPAQSKMTTPPPLVCTLPSVADSLLPRHTLRVIVRCPPTQMQGISSNQIPLMNGPQVTLIPPWPQWAHSLLERNCDYHSFAEKLLCRDQIYQLEVLRISVHPTLVVLRHRLTILV